MLRACIGGLLGLIRPLASPFLTHLVSSFVCGGVVQWCIVLVFWLGRAGTIVIIAHSGEARNAVVRPRMQELRSACEAANVRLHTVVLYRDPLAATYSRVHQMQYLLRGHILLQAR